MTAREVYTMVSSILDNTDNWFPVMQSENPQLALEIFNQVVNFAQLEFVREKVALDKIDAVYTLQWQVRYLSVTGENVLPIAFDVNPEPEMLFLKGVLLSYKCAAEYKKPNIPMIERFIVPTYTEPYYFYNLKNEVKRDSFFNDFIYTVISEPDPLDNERLVHKIDILCDPLYQYNLKIDTVIYIRKPRKFQFTGSDQNDVTLEIPRQYHYDIVLRSAYKIDSLDVNELGRYAIGEGQIGIREIKDA